MTVFLSLVRAVTAVVHGVAQLMAVDAAVVVAAESERSFTLDVQAEVKLLVRSVSAVIVSVTFPLRLNTNVVLAFEQKGGAVRAVGKPGWTQRLICVVQTISVAITLETLSNAVSTAALEVSRMTRPQLTVPFIRVVLTVVVMVTDPTVGNAAQIITTKLALRACAWRAAALV